MFPKHLGFFPPSASCNHQKLKKTKTWSCTQLLSRHFPSRAHGTEMTSFCHVVTEQRDSKTSFLFNSVHTPRDFSSAKIFDASVGAPANFEDSPHRNKWVIFDGISPRSAANSDMFVKSASGNIGTDHCVIKEDVFEYCYCWWFHPSPYLLVYVTRFWLRSSQNNSLRVSRDLCIFWMSRIKFYVYIILCK